MADGISTTKLNLKKRPKTLPDEVQEPIRKKGKNQSLQSLSSIVTKNSETIGALSALPTILNEQAKMMRELKDAVRSLTYDVNVEGAEANVVDIETEKDPFELLVSSVTAANQSTDLGACDASKNDNKASTKPNEQTEQDSSQDTGSEILADDVVEALLLANQAEAEYGPELKDSVAKAFLRTVELGFTKEQLEQRRSDYKIPINAKELGVPRVNKEIWNPLPRRAQTADVTQQYTQQFLSKALIAQAHAVETLVEHSKSVPPDVVKPVMVAILDAANYLGTAIKDISMKRRNQIKPFLAPESAGVCGANVPVTEYLFGSTLEKDLTSSRVASRIVRQFSSPSSRGFQRFNRPYRPNVPATTSFSTNRNLNWRGPLNPRGGNRNFRGRSVFRQSQGRSYN